MFCTGIRSQCTCSLIPSFLHPFIRRCAASVRHWGNPLGRVPPAKMHNAPWGRPWGCPWGRPCAGSCGNAQVSWIRPHSLAAASVHRPTRSIRPASNNRRGHSVPGCAPGSVPWPSSRAADRASGLRFEPMEPVRGKAQRPGLGRAEAGAGAEPQGRARGSSLGPRASGKEAELSRGPPWPDTDGAGA